MNIFRRFLSQPNNAGEPEKDKETTPTPSEPLADLTKPFDDSAPADTTPVSPPTENKFNPVMDGVTRPLPPDTPMEVRDHLIFGQASDVGTVRANNQDAVLSFFSTSRSADDRPDFGVFIVADGMGGHHDGEKASAITTRTLAAEIINVIFLPMLSGDNNPTPISEVLVDAVQKANTTVLNEVPDGGTTLTAVTIINDLAYIVHVGDSRVYLLTKDGMEQITRDHSLVQRLIELDQLTPEEAADHPQKNVLYRALGQNETLEVDTITRRLPPNSKLLLCCDGLWNQVADHEIADTIKKYTNPQEACEKLVTLANSRGGVDNVTIVLLHLPG